MFRVQVGIAPGLVKTVQPLPFRVSGRLTSGSTSSPQGLQAGGESLQLGERRTLNPNSKIQNSKFIGGSIGDS